jgi:uncharacterized membrane protein (DUF485 family)
MGMQHYYRRIYDDPKFHELEKKRSIFSWSLTIIILICYFSFIMVIAFFPHIFAQTISVNSTITWGIPIGLLVIVISFLLTGFYVYRANSEFDLISKEIIDHHINDARD